MFSVKLIVIMAEEWRSTLSKKKKKNQTPILGARNNWI